MTRTRQSACVIVIVQRDQLDRHTISAPYWKLMATDGLAPPTVYVVATDGDIMTPRFTGTHVAWVKGYDRNDISWKKMEIWASPYSADPTALQPTLVAAWPYTGVILETKAAFGRLGTASILSGSDLRSVNVWSIPDGEHRQLTFPDDGSLLAGFFFGGLTRDEVVFGVRKPGGAGDFSVFRVPVAKMSVVP